MPFPCYSGWEPYSPIIPTLYYDVESVEKRTKLIAVAIERIEQYCDLVAKELNEHGSSISALKTEDVRLLNLINDNFDVLYGLIQTIQKTLEGIAEGGQLMYDYVTAEYEDSKQAVRTMRNDVNTVDGFTVAETACYTVKQMANSRLTARGWALVSRNAMKPHRPPRDMFVPAPKCACK